MKEIEQKAVEEMADRIGKFYNYQITQSDTYELAEFLYIAGYRKQSETVKEFARKLKAIIDLDRDKEEFLNRPKTAKATDYWLKEWYDKCNMLNDLAVQCSNEE